MSNSENNINDLRGTNDHWSGIEANYPAGIILEHDMFPLGRDSRLWGLQDPLDVVGRKSLDP